MFYRSGMKPPGDCRLGQEAVRVKEEPPEHSPPPRGAPALSEPPHQPTPVQLVYNSHGVCLENNTFMSADSATKVHIKDGPLKYMKEEALSVEGELQSSSSEAGLHGVSAAAMLAGLYSDHVVKDEVLLGPELPHRPTVNPVFYVHIKEEPRKYVKEEQLSVEGELQSSSSEAGLHGVSVAAMLAGLYSDHVVKDEVLLGPELPHRPTVNPVFYGRAVSLDAGVAEALARAATPATDIYRCDHGDKTFAYKSVLSEHIHTHLSTRLALSRYSTREDSNLDQNQKLDTSFKGNLQNHESTLTREKTFQCNYCDYKCNQKSYLRTHEMTHTGVKPYKCNYCDYKCSRKEHIETHEMTHTGVKPYQCNYCDYKCRYKGHLRTHEMTHTGVKPYQCKYCDYKCTRKGSLRIHELTHNGVKPYKCNYCDYKCSRKEHIETHEMTHTGVKPYQCNYCDYKCRYKGHLRTHEMTHTGVKPYQCKYCDYKCTRKGSLRIHELTHNGVKPYQCKYCVYKCTLKGRLRIHEMTHTGVKPYQCNYCDYKCSQKGNLRTHEITHTGVKPYQCNYCDYKCNRKGHLRTHEMTHTAEKPYQFTTVNSNAVRKDT